MTCACKCMMDAKNLHGANFHSFTFIPLSAISAFQNLPLDSMMCPLNRCDQHISFADTGGLCLIYLFFVQLLLL